MTMHPFLMAVRATDTVTRTGRVLRILPTSIEADGPAVPIGTLCDVEAEPNRLLAKVAAVRHSVDMFRDVVRTRFHRT